MFPGLKGGKQKAEGKEQEGALRKLRVISVTRDNDAQNWLINWKQSFGKDGDRSEPCDA